MSSTQNPESGKKENIKLRPHDHPVTPKEMNEMEGREEHGKRTRSGKVFSLGRNLFQAVLYPDAVHYQDKQSGEWREIDNTLIARQDTTGEYLTNAQNGDLSVQMRSAQNERMITLQNGEGQSISWRIEDAADVSPVAKAKPAYKHKKDDKRRGVLDHLEGTAEYPELLPGVTLRCTARGDSFKDELIFADAQSMRPISFLLATPGLVPQIKDGGQIDIVAPDGAVPFALPAPFVLDQDERQGAVAVSLQPTEQRDVWHMTYTPDAKWLENAAYPVVLDPVVQTRTISSTMEDNFVTSKSPNTVQPYANTNLQITKGSSTYGHSVAYLKFLNSSLPDISSSYYITKAYLNMSLKSRPNASVVVYLREVLSAWSSQTITYNTQPSLSEKYLDYLYFNTTSTINGYYYYDISNLVRKWYATGVNNGVMFEPGSNTVMHFNSSDSVYYKPYIVINYVSLAGLEDSLAYEDQSAGRAGTGHVSLYNGNLIFEHQETSMNGNLMPVSLARVYNSCYRLKNALGAGKGWMISGQQSLHKEVLDSGSGTITYYVYTDSDGTRHFFMQSSGVWKDMSGLSLTLTISGSTATITDKGDNKLTFDLPTVNFVDNDESADISGFANVKMLKSATDACGNTATYTTTSDRRLTKVTDGAGRETTLSVSGGNIVSAQAPGCAALAYGYDASGRLTSVTHEDGKVTSYTYNALDLLETVTNHDGLKLTYSYYTTRAPYRVSRVEVTNGATKISGRKYEYGDCLTTVTDLYPVNGVWAEGKKIFYHFNDYGNVVSVNDQLGYACFAKYSDTLPVNHPEVASKMQRAVVNLLKNHNFEATTNWTNANIGGTGTYSFATDNKHMGAKSLKMAKTNASGQMTSYQAVTLEKGKTYTFSAYFKTLTGASAQLRATVDGVNYDSLTQQNTAAWDRISLTFTVPVGASSAVATLRLMAADGIGSVWFDSAQLEEGAVANRYNMLINGDFTFNVNGKPEKWLENSSNAAADKVYATYEGQKPEGLSQNTLRIYGAGRTTYPGIYQDIPMTGLKNDVYSAGGDGDERRLRRIKRIGVPMRQGAM